MYTVFAVDDETALVVECKCAESYNDKKQWKTELEAIKGYMPQKIQERNINALLRAVQEVAK